MKQYQDVLRKILREGTEKESARTNMPNTMGISKADISMDLTEGFPLLTTKRVYWKGIIHELLWFLRGETNIKYLVDNNVNIWNQDAYRWYCKYAEVNNSNPNPIMRDNGDGTLSMYTFEEFIDIIKNNKQLPCTQDNQYRLGDLGKVYGAQWRNQNGVDQVADVIKSLKEAPSSRYHIIDGWNKSDFVDMALPPCHLLYQFITRPMNLQERYDYLVVEMGGEIPENFSNDNSNDDELISILNELGVPTLYLDLNMYQRSVDTPLGCPFNLASMSLLNMIMAETCDMVAGVANWIGGDTHIYVNQLEGVREQLSRTPTKLPKMMINKELNNLGDIEDLTIDDFSLVDYNPQPTIKFELSTGMVKK